MKAGRDVALICHEDKAVNLHALKAYGGSKCKTLCVLDLGTRWSSLGPDSFNRGKDLCTH